MLSCGLEGLPVYEVCKWMTENKWHTAALVPQVLRIDTEQQVYNWYEDLLTLEGRGLLTCLVAKATPGWYFDEGRLYFSIHTPDYQSHYPGYGEFWFRGADLAPDGEVTFAYRGFVAFEEWLKVKVAFTLNDRYVRFTGTVWYVTY